jgi:hypothetical protein
MTRYFSVCFLAAGLIAGLLFSEGEIGFGKISAPFLDHTQLHDRGLAHSV